MDAFQRNQSAVARRLRRQCLRRHRQAQHGDVRGRGPGLHRQEGGRKPSGSEVDAAQGRARGAQGQSRQAGQLTRMRISIAAALALVAAASRSRPDRAAPSPISAPRRRSAAIGPMGANRRRQRGDVHRCHRPAAADDPLHPLDPPRLDRQAGERGSAVPQRLDELADRAACRRASIPRPARLSASFAAFDPLLDALASSRGRVGFSVPASPPLVVPPWAEIARVSRIAASEFARSGEVCRIFTSLQVLRCGKQKFIFALASTQRKEVIRCLMVQQGGRRGVFAGPDS